MIRQCSVLLAAGILVSTHHQVNAAIDPFLEQNGRLVVEVESGSAQGDWSIEQEIDGFTGSSYLVWRGGNNLATSQAPRGNPITYHFRISTPGNYELRWRSRNTIGLDPTEHNDGWVQFPTGSNIEGQHSISGWTKAYMGQVSKWTWDTYTVDGNNQLIRQFFDEGDHVIEISGRSTGHAIDRFALYHYETTGFSEAQFDALPQSPLVSQAGQPAHPYSGNSCVAGNLSLAASAARQASAGADVSDTLLLIDNSPEHALLRFDIPQGLDNTDATLMLASSTGAALQVSAYLGSHSNWNNDTPADAMPYPSTLLGLMTGAAGEGSIASLSVDNSMLSSESVTFVLSTEPGQTELVYGIGSALEPRLEMQVSNNFCDTYNLARNGADEVAGGTENGTEAGAGSGTEGTIDESDIVDPTDNTDSGDIENTAGGETPSGQPVSESGDNSNVEVPVVENNGNLDRENAGENVVAGTSTRTGGGSLSGWAVIFLSAGILARLYNRRWKLLAGLAA